MGEIDTESVDAGPFQTNILSNKKWMQRVIEMTSDTLLVLDKEDQCIDLLLKTDNPILNIHTPIIGTNFIRMLPLETAALVKKEVDAVRRTGVTSNMNYDLPVDGKMFYFKLIVHKFDEQWLLCQYRDITQRSNMKKNLLSKTQALQEVGRVAMIVHWSFDTVEEVISYPKYAVEEKVFALDSETTTLTEFLLSVHEDDRSKLADFLHDPSNSPITTEFRLLRVGMPVAYLRTTRYGDQHGQRVISGLTQDVTDFMKNRSELEVVVSVVHRSPRSVVAVNSVGDIIFINKVGRTMNGLTEDQDLTGLTVMTLMPDFSTLAKWNSFKASLLASTEEFHFRMKNPLPSGDSVDMECIASVVKNWEGDDIIWFFQHDISDQVRYEEQLVKAKEAAEESEKLKMAFITNMNHEIRTPLNAIVGLSMLIADTDDAESRHEYAKLVTASSDQLLRLITDVLEMSQIDAGNMRLVPKMESLNTILHELKLSFSHVVDRAELVVNIPVVDTIAYIDKGRIMQLLTNMVNNSRKFTPVDGAIIVGYTLAEGNIEFYVIDNGIGIAKDKQGLIFNRFYKVDAHDQGTGLGLSICKSIVDQMKGKITVNSEEKVGTTFNIQLPLIVGGV